MQLKSITTIGDVHGLTLWEDLVSRSDLDIFLGDYVDQGRYNRQTGRWEKTISNSDIITNLEKIIAHKELNMDKVVLLLGNHDIQYFIPNMICSGYRAEMKYDLRELFMDNLHLFQYAYQEGSIMWSHAGLCRQFYHKHIKSHKNDYETIAETVNRLALDEFPPIFYVGAARGGYKPTGGPLWLDKRVLESQPLKGYTQIVGHTKVEDIEVHVGEDYKLYFADCLHNNKHLEIEV